MPLSKYQNKRKFEKTPEPKGKVEKADKNRFVIQEHWASHHHFDFRLEQNGVLKSWAVPKGLAEEISVKRLAVQVEDHPIDYINFHGTIPPGQYGSGKVEIYDKGKYKITEQDKNKIIFELKGKKIKGSHVLIRMKNTKNWLIWKIK